MSLINTSTDPMQESLFSKSIQRGKLTVVERPDMSVSLKHSFLDHNKGRSKSQFKARDLNVIRYGSLDAADDFEEKNVTQLQAQQIRKIKEGKHIEKYSQGRDNDYGNFDYSDQNVFSK